MPEEISIPLADTQFLLTHLYHRENSPLVIFSHGMLSSRKGKKISHLGPRIYEAGFSLLAFDFSPAEDPPESYRKLSIEREVEELRAVVTWGAERYPSIHLVGSSLGGTVSMLYAARYGAVASLTTLASPVDLREMVNLWGLSCKGEEELVYFESIAIPQSFVDQCCTLNVSAEAASIDVPILAFHGTGDDTVPYRNLALLTNSHPRRRSVTIDGGGHSLSEESDLEVIEKELVQWLIPYLA
jgi:uncharacterized protein